MDKRFPFRAEYAISDGAKCNVCNRMFDVDSLRIGKCVPSPCHDGVIYHWHHLDCIFSTPQKPKNISLIANFDNIRWNDQEHLKIKAGGWSEPLKDISRVVNGAILERPQLDNLAKYKIEYANSDSTCFDCNNSIDKGDIQVSKKEEKTVLFNDWYHLKCFVNLRNDFHYFISGSCLPGFSDLTKEDQDIVLMQLPPVDNEDLPPVVKRGRLDSIAVPEMNDWVSLMKKQNEKFFSMRDKIKQLGDDEMIDLLKFNNQRFALKREDLMDALADRLAFGSVNACGKCFGRRKFISGYGYVCMGTTKWTMCYDISTEPKKTVFNIPQGYKVKYEFLKSYVPNVEKRVMRITAPSNFSLNPVSPDHSNNSQQNIDPNLLTDKLKYARSAYFQSIIIDPKTHFQDIAQVYQCNSEKYAVTLVVTNIQADLNSFYKLWIMQYFHEKKYSLLRSWGRIGTKSTGSMFEVMPLNKCINKFKTLFYEKSGNHWSNRNQFIKYSYKMYLIDTRDDVDVKTVIESKLPPPICSLMSLIFNLNLIKNLMIDFRIDVDRMPSSKLSKSQIYKAFHVLNKLQDLITCNISDKKALLDASNKFYTLIPHSFGTLAPPILDNIDKIKEKCEMLNTLMELEIAHNLMNLETDEQKEHSLDAVYKKLNIKIDILDSDSEEYKLIEKYAKNTHAVTHSDYTLQIENVFKIERQGEADRYQRFENLHNKKLLWHGSRTTNFAGILSQGLRVAPPEAPSSGYMFGKGIYFADMVSKSANYCHANEQNPTGLLLLCEVALGNMYEQYQECRNLELPENKHSTFGKGQTYPNPEESYRFSNGIEIPYGTPISHSETSVHGSDSTELQLLYNEYIVYDSAQVRSRYLVRVKFNFE